MKDIELKIYGNIMMYPFTDGDLVRNVKYWLQNDKGIFYEVIKVYDNNGSILSDWEPLNGYNTLMITFQMKTGYDKY